MYDQNNIISKDKPFIKLPNSTIWCANNDEESLKIQLGDYPFTMSSLIYLASNLTIKGYTVFSLKDMMLDCGYSIGKSKNVSNFKNFISGLVYLGVLEDIDDEDIKKNDLVKSKLYLDTDKNFFKFYLEYFDIIMESKHSSPIKNNTITVLCYILATTNKKLECAFFSLDTAVIDLKISKSTILKCINILNELGIIYSDHIGSIGSVKTPNYYSTSLEGLYKGLKESYMYYKDDVGFLPNKDLLEHLDLDI